MYIQLKRFKCKNIKQESNCETLQPHDNSMYCEVGHSCRRVGDGAEYEEGSLQ